MLMIEDKSSATGCYLGKYGGEWGVYFPIGYDHPYMTVSKTATHEFAPFGAKAEALDALEWEEEDLWLR